MNARFTNVYDDKARADAYAKLEFPGTYYLAYPYLPAIISEHVNGTAALDFGCGTGRSTRFLHRLGFGPVVCVDIASHMVAQARELDPRWVRIATESKIESRWPPPGSLGRSMRDQ